MKNFTAIMMLSLFMLTATAQIQPKTEKGIFKTYGSGYFDVIKQGISDYDNKSSNTGRKPVFKANAAEYNIPASAEGFTTCWHNGPVSQGNTNTCWSFSATSYLESEVYRTTGKKFRLSEIHTVYYEYIEKISTWVKTRGNMFFGEGSEADAVTRIWKKYGAVPYENYTGFLPGQTFHNHEVMFNEIRQYLEFVKQNNLWDEQAVISNCKSILKHYIGEPPVTVTVEGRLLTPLQFMHDVLQINPDDYCSVLSYMQKPYWQKVEYEVPDNWWHGADYYNIPLDDFTALLKKALASGYSCAIGGDVSEAGYLSREANAAIVPSFDIPSANIDENARQFRFSNGSTEDDHGLHVVGFKEINGITWYLVKDSGAGARSGGSDKNKNFGYMFYHQDYVKLKMMDFMVHKDMMKEVIKKVEENHTK